MNSFHFPTSLYNQDIQYNHPISPNLNCLIYLPDNVPVNHLNLYPVYPFRFYNHGTSNTDFQNLTDNSKVNNLQLNYYFQNFMQDKTSQNKRTEEKSKSKNKDTSSKVERLPKSSSKDKSKSSQKGLGKKRNRDEDDISEESSEEGRIQSTKKSNSIIPIKIDKQQRKNQNENLSKESSPVKAGGSSGDPKYRGKDNDSSEGGDEGFQNKAKPPLPYKRKNKKNHYEELLQDSFLEHFGEKKFPQPLPLDTISILENVQNGKSKKKSSQKNTNKNGKSQKNIKKKKPDENAQDMTTTKYQSTKGIFYGDDYKKTSSVEDFMKYNFNFSIEEKYKTQELITDVEAQHVNLEKLKSFSLHKNLEEDYCLKPKWLRTKFQGDNKELKESIDLVKDIIKGNRAKMSEEQCLDILRLNDYNKEELMNFKCK